MPSPFLLYTYILRRERANGLGRASARERTYQLRMPLDAHTWCVGSTHQYFKSPEYELLTRTELEVRAKLVSGSFP